MTTDTTPDKFVIVTIASNGVVHAWGEGPVIGGTVTPFGTRVRANAAARRMRRAEKKRLQDPFERERGTVKMHVCAILGHESVSL